jgi:hypothetical protein
LVDAYGNYIIIELFLWKQTGVWQVEIFQFNSDSTKKCKERRISFKQAPSVFSEFEHKWQSYHSCGLLSSSGSDIQSNLKCDQHVEKICKKCVKASLESTVETGKS